MELSLPEGTTMHVINNLDTACREGAAASQTIIAKKGHTCFHCGLVAKTKKSLGTHIEQCHLDSTKMLVTKIRMSVPVFKPSLTEPFPDDHVIATDDFLSSSHGNAHDQSLTSTVPCPPPTARVKRKPSNPGRHHCTTCGYIAVSAGKLKVHLRSHTGEKPYSCSYCNYAYAYKSGLNAHIRKYHTQENMHCCPHCSYKALRPGHLERHIRSHTGEKPFPCKMCDSSFSCMEYLNDHVRDFHYRERLFACPHCNKKLARPSHLRSHLRTHAKKPVVTLIEKPDAILVDSPDISQDSVSDLLKSFNGQYSGTSLKEESNGESCETTLSGEMGLAGERTIMCDEPDKTTVELGEGKQFCCQLCDFKCPTSRGLVDHVETHKRSKPFGCTLCPFRCKFPTQLKTHIALHTGDKPFKCPHCDACFTLQGRLNQHIIIHSEEKRLKCEQCDYSCFYQSEMRKHLVKHAERKLSCPVCNKKFTGSSYLTQHLKRVHRDFLSTAKDFIQNEKRVKCEQCDYVCSYQSELRKHTVKHSEQKKCCPVCNKKFSGSAYMNQHLKRIHGDACLNEDQTGYETEIRDADGYSSPSEEMNEAVQIEDDSSC